MKPLRYCVLVLLLFAFGPKVYSQGCSVCSRTAATGSSKTAAGLNSGIIYLALLPLCIMGTVGFAWWRNQRKSQS